MLCVYLDHPGCFKCSEGTCEILLDQYHYVLGGLPYCEQHAREIEDQDTMPSTAQSVSPPRTTEDGGDFYDARYGNGVPPVTNTASIPEARRRSASLDIPAQSLNALRKNAQAPNYRGMLARRRSSARRRPSETGNLGGWNHQHAAASQQYQQSMRSAAGPPPVSRTRRAEKRRTVISQIRLH